PFRGGSAVRSSARVKPCPFCAESIQDAAVKCRFCGSMLDGSQADHQAHAQGAHEHALVTTTIFEGSPSWKAWFWSYFVAGVPSIVLVGLIWMLVLNAQRKALRYKLTDRTIDYERGVFSKQIETLQLWRVQDIDFKQSFFERLLGIATIYVFTK